MTPLEQRVYELLAEPPEKLHTRLVLVTGAHVGSGRMHYCRNGAEAAALAEQNPVLRHARCECGKGGVWDSLLTPDGILATGMACPHDALKFIGCEWACPNGWTMEICTSKVWAERFDLLIVHPRTHPMTVLGAVVVALHERSGWPEKFSRWRESEAAKNVGP